MILKSFESVDNTKYSQDHIKEIVIMSRLYLYNHNFCCGAKFIRKELHTQGIQPLPSLNLISRILKKNGLTHRRIGFL